ncbi:MAG TPA: hypothetical protein VH540_16500 [Ktedonobacterales bacterium]|jgi:lysine biosynthesis protein LysW
MANCPECGGNVPTANIERGELLPCPDFGAELEVRVEEKLLMEAFRAPVLVGSL